MNSSTGESSAGGAGRGLGGTSTGRIHAGRYVLDVNSAGGTRLYAAPRSGRTDPPPDLSAAVAADRDAPTKPLIDRVDEFVDKQSEITEKKQRVVDVLTEVVNGVPDVKSLADVLDGLANFLGRLSASGRYGEAIEYGRQLVRLLALTLRWFLLVAALRELVDAATALADESGRAWALHELGTLHVAGGDLDGGRQLLEEAREIRRRIGDNEGLAATEHNLAVIAPRRPGVPRTALAGIGILVLFVAGFGVAGAVSDSSTPVAPTQPTSPTTHPTSPTTRPPNPPAHPTGTLHVTASGPGTVSSPSLSCSNTCTWTYSVPTTVTLTETPSTTTVTTATSPSTAAFSGWSGGQCSGTAPTCPVAVAKATTTVEATFTTPTAPVTYELMVFVNESRVTESTSGMTCPPAATAPPTTTSATAPPRTTSTSTPSCIWKYPAGTSVTLTADSSGADTFVGWGGDCSGPDLSCTLTMNGLERVTATFEQTT